MVRKKQGIAFLLVSIMLISGCGSTEEVTEESKVDVETAYPVVRTVSQAGNFIGTIEAEAKVSVTPRLTGIVTSKNFKVGDHVNAGDVLFTLDDREYVIEKNNAEANVRTAKAALDAQKARNEETKASAAETLGTIDTKELELNNSVKSSEREEGAAQIKRDGFSRDDSIYKSEEERIKRLQNEAGERMALAQKFSWYLNSIKAVYNEIAASDQPAELAKIYGVSEEAIGEETDPGAIAGIYLRTTSQYSSVEELETAITTCTEAEKSAESEKKELDGSASANLISRIEAEVNIQLENGNISNAQDARSLADKMRRDYENFSKAQIMADAQAKIAEGDAAVVTSDGQLVNAQTELATAKLKLEYSTVKSPISGIIQEVNIEQYGMASDQSPAYVITNPDRKKAVFYVTEDVKKNLLVNQKVQISKNGTDFDAYVNSISDTVDEQKKLYKIEATLDEKAQEVFSAGSSIKLNTCVRSEQSAVTVPIGAVYYSEGKPYVYVAEGGKAIKKDIETGIFDDSDIQVISGISEDDQFIVSWTAQLKDQADINVKNTPTKPAKEAPSDKETATEDTGNKLPADNSTQTEAENAKSAVEQKMIETTDRVNIRKGPGKDTDKLKTVPAGSRFVKTDETDGWTKIIFDEKEGYIKSEYVRECNQ